MKQDPELQGLFSLDMDGVLRSWDADRNVVDAVPLSPELIKAYNELPPPPSEAVSSAYEGIDGTKVPKEQWFKSPQHLIPEPLAEEHRERDPEKLAAYRKAYEEQRSRYGNGGHESSTNEGA